MGFIVHYAGCQSWRFYYDQHYAPFAVDLLHMRLWHHHIGRMPKPLAQLLAVIPRARRIAYQRPAG